MTCTIEILERLIAFPTVSAESNLQLIAYVHAYLSERGFEIHQIGDASADKAGLFATIGPKGEGGILLSAHSDVVPVEGQNWKSDPFKLKVDDGRAYGRGTTDMKGYLASMLSLADKVDGKKLKEPLKFSLSYDEEIGCVGIKSMIGRLQSTIGKPRMCIVGEPTSMRVAVGHKGKAALLARFRGESGHSAMAPNFVNALHMATDFIVAIRELQNKFSVQGPREVAYDIPYSTIHVGKLNGGHRIEHGA